MWLNGRSNLPADQFGLEFGLMAHLLDEVGQHRLETAATLHLIVLDDQVDVKEMAGHSESSLMGTTRAFIRERDDLATRFVPGAAGPLVPVAAS